MKIAVYKKTGEMHADGKVIKLTDKELALVDTLADMSVHAKPDIMTALYPDTEQPDSRVIDWLADRLNEEAGEDIIKMSADGYWIECNAITVFPPSFGPDESALGVIMKIADEEAA